MSGRVTNVVKFGAFVELDGGLEGLIHYTELPQPVEPGSDEDGVRAQAAEGDSVLVRVLAIDLEKRRVSLTMRQPHPWLDGVGLPPIGAHVSGTAVKVDEEGVRVVVPDRLLGIYRAAGFGEPGHALTVGSEVELIVVGHDRAARRLELIAIMLLAPDAANARRRQRGRRRGSRLPSAPEKWARWRDSRRC